MSSITKIISKFNENEKYRNKCIKLGLYVEGGGIHRKYEYLVTFNKYGLRCGYVEIDKENKVYNKKLDEYSEEDEFDFDVHGGITYHSKDHALKELLNNICQIDIFEDEWIGFDAGHCYDDPDYSKVEKYFGINHPFLNFPHTYIDGGHKTYDYMEDQCFKLIDQLKTL